MSDVTPVSTSTSPYSHSSYDRSTSTKSPSVDEDDKVNKEETSGQSTEVDELLDNISSGNFFRSRSFSLPKDIQKPETPLIKRRVTISEFSHHDLKKSVRITLPEKYKELYDDSFVDQNGLTLIYSRYENVPFKDFNSEVRAIMDVQSFINNTALLLDPVKTSLDEIIEFLLEKMLGHLENYKETMNLAISSLFTNDYVHQLSRTLQCSSKDNSGGGFVYGQNFVCALCSISAIHTRYVGIARLSKPTNLGQTCQEVSFIILVLTPIREKGTKNELETGRTFATMLTGMDFRQALLKARNEDEFKEAMMKQMYILSQRQRAAESMLHINVQHKIKIKLTAFKGLLDDLGKRIPCYVSDYVDGVSGWKTVQKVISTTFFLYFACILPSIAFGVLNAVNTNGTLTVEKVLYTQTFGGLLFAVFGGTPQVVLLTTAPLALFTKIYKVRFESLFCCVGLWNAFFLILYAIFNFSDLMQYSTRSTEEIFSLFIAIAFAHGAFKNAFDNFEDTFGDEACRRPVSSSLYYELLSNKLNKTPITHVARPEGCYRDTSLLYILLLFGTVWLGVTLFRFTDTPYLTAAKRELASDYSLPVAVVIMSFIGCYLFRAVQMGLSFSGLSHSDLFQLNTMHDLPSQAIVGGMGLGFCLSLLFYMGQNICAKFVNDPQNRLKKGTAYHWDLFVIALINAALSLYTFPWLHAALPHSPMHVYALADIEDQMEQGHVKKIIVRVRETRLTGIFAHILIGLSLIIMPILAYIPTPVLYGVFLYLAITALFKNQIVERVALFFTDQAAYPPNHYIRRVPQWKIHMFTLLQIVQLTILCLVGFLGMPYLKMFFPVLIFLLIPIRHSVLPMLYYHIRSCQRSFKRNISKHWMVTSSVALDLSYSFRTPHISAFSFLTVWWGEQLITSC